MVNEGRVRRVVVLTFLFLSGGTGLVYQAVWSKYLSNHLGNTGQAHSVVIATFMGGLALGAYLFGSLSDQSHSPLRLYGLLELGVGVYALVFPYVLDALGGVYLVVAPSVPEALRAVPRLLLAALSLLVPTLLMGGTLPALARFFTRDLGGLQKEIATLYAVNSLGAALGVVLAGYGLMPGYGLAVSSNGAAAVNLLLALGVLVLARRGRGAAAYTAPGGDEPLELPARMVKAALWGVAFSGFTSMLYEVTWIRILAITLGASVYAFTTILGVFIFGIGTGSFWLARRDPKSPLAVFGVLQLLLVVAICFAVPLYVRLPWLFWKTRYLLSRSEDAWPLYQVITFGFCAAILLVPTFVMGASFPAAARVATARMRDLGRRLGHVYLWNTVGTVSGAALGGLVLLPAIGMEGNILLGIGCNLGAGLYALWAAGRLEPSPRAVGLGGAVAVGLFLIALQNGWSIVVSNSSALRMWSRPPETFADWVSFEMNDVQVRYRKDDTFATVLVGEGPNGFKFIRMNGKADASNGADIRTQIMAGHLGALFHPRAPKRVLLVGSGAAITAGSVLAHEEVERLDLVEISPAVIEAARLFSADNRNALEDPRLQIHIEDAKTFMAMAKERYDLIVSVPSNPWVSGVSGLFTREFFQNVHAHLADDGILVQWIHTYESREEMVALVMRTLRETFPYATTWEALPSDLIMVTSKRPLTFDPARIEARMARPAVREDLARADVKDLATLLASQMHSSEGQLAFAGEGPINTDDLNLLEYGSPVAFFLEPKRIPLQDERRSLATAHRLFMASWLAAHPPTPEEAENIHRYMVKMRSKTDPLVLASAELWFRTAPGPASRAALAQTLLSLGDLGRAREVLAAAEDTPELTAVWQELERREATIRLSIWNPAPGARVETARPAVGVETSP